MNTMKAIKICMLITAVIISMASSCDDRSDEHKHYTIVNKSSRNISCQMSELGIKTLTDTIFQCGVPTISLLVDSLFPIKSPGYKGGWETILKGVSYLQLLIMDDSIYIHYSKMYNYNCDTIHKYVPILYRYQLTLEDLQQMNWTVVYPPPEE